jgi:hypothetical protein
MTTVCDWLCRLWLAPCSLKGAYRSFRGTCCLHRQAISALMMDAVRTSETSVNINEATSIGIMNSHSKRRHVTNNSDPKGRTWTYIESVPECDAENDVETVVTAGDNKRVVICTVYRIMLGWNRQDIRTCNAHGGMRTTCNVSVRQVGPGDPV